MPPNRNIVLVKMLDDDSTDESSSMLNAVPLGSLQEVVGLFARFNTATDGSPDSIGMLYGPGYVVQLPMVGPKDPIAQVMVSIDEEIAWPVLARMCKVFGWKMMDPGSGRTFGG